MPTVVTHTIKPDGTGDFTSAAAWAASCGRDLVSLDEVEDVECYSGNLGQLDLTSTSFVSDDNRYINVRAASGHKASSDIRKACPIFYLSTASVGQAVHFGDNRCNVSGVRAHVHFTASSIAATCFLSNNSSFTSYVAYKGCIASFSYALTTQAGHPTGFAGQFLAIGCLAVASNQSSLISSGRLTRGFSIGAFNNNQTRPVGAINCTAHGIRSATGIGILLNTTGSPAYLLNCIVTGVGTQNFTSYDLTTTVNVTYGGLFVDGSTAASHEAGAQPIEAKLLDDANQRFGLAYNSPLIGAGINMSALADEDINGVAFPATGPWDVGCAQYTGPSASRARSPGRLPRFAMTPMNPARALANGANAGVVAKIGFFSLPPADVSVPGTASAEAAGTPTVSAIAAVAVQSVLSGFASGNASISTRYPVAPSGVASKEAPGTPTVISRKAVAPTGVASGFAAGTPTVTTIAIPVVRPAGVASAEAVGAPAVISRKAVAPTGVSSGFAAGTPAVTTRVIYTVRPTGVGTGFAAGSPSATTRKTVAPTGVASGFAAGNATLRAKATVRAQGVPGGELIGTAVVLARFRVQAQSVPSAEAVGTPLVGSRWAIVATGLESGSAFGTPYLFIGSSARRRALSPWRDYAAESYLRYRSVVAALRAAGAESGGEERAVASPARITTVSSTDD